MAKRDEQHKDQQEGGGDNARQASEHAREAAEKMNQQGREAAEKMNQQGREAAEKFGQEGREGAEKFGQQGREAAEKFGHAEKTGQQGREAAEKISQQGRESAEKLTREMAQTGRMAAERGTEQMMRVGRAQTDQMRSALASSADVYRDLATYSRDDVEALMQSGAVLARGAQEIGWEVMQLTQHSLRRGFEAANELMGCRSVEDMLSVQRDLMRENVEKLMDSGARMLEMSSRVASEAVQPVRERVGEKKRGGEKDEEEPGRTSRGASSGERARQAGRGEART